MKALLKAISVLTLAASTTNLTNVLHTTYLKSKVVSNDTQQKTQQITEGIDYAGNKVSSDKHNLSNLNWKEVTQIGFYTNMYHQIQAVRMPKTIKFITEKLPKEIINTCNMFQGCSKFNQSLAKWDTSNVTNMRFMFYRAVMFNSDITTWNTAKVTSMNLMFYHASNFNQNISRWDVGNVVHMNLMFNAAKQFDQNLSNWNVSKVAEYVDFAKNTKIADSPEKLPKFRNDNLII